MFGKVFWVSQVHILVKSIKKNSQIKILFSAIFSGTVAFYLYFNTLAPGLIQYGDSPKFQFIGSVYGIPHSTGYPLYIFISAIFVRTFPGYPVAYLTNLLSAIFAVATVGLVSAWVARLTRSVFYALLAALLLATSAIFWSQAIIAEVYTINAFFVSLLFWWIIVWEDTQQVRYVFIAWATICIGLGNHATLIFFAAAFWIYIITNYKQILIGKKNILIIFVISLIVPIQYLLLYEWSWQNPLYSELEPGSLSQYLAFLRGSDFQSRFFARDFFSGATIFQEIMVTNISLVAVGLAFIGLLALFSQRGLLIFFVTSLLMYLGFTITYAITDIAVYFIPVIVMFTLLAGLGLKKIENDARYFFSASTGIIIGGLIAFSLLPFIIQQYYINSSQLGDWFLETQNTKNLRTQLNAIPPESIIFTPANRDWWRVLYLKYVEGLAPTTQVEKFAEKLPPDRPIYAVKPDFNPLDYYVEVNYLGEDLLKLLDDLTQSEIVIITLLNFDATKNSPEVWSTLNQFGLQWQPLENAHNVILFGVKNGQNNSWVALDPLQTISVGVGEKFPETDVYSPVSLMVSTKPNNSELMLTINHQVVLKPDAEFGIVLLTATGKIKAAGEISLERSLINEVPLYHLVKPEKIDN